MSKYTTANVREYNQLKDYRNNTCVCCECGKTIEMTGKNCVCFGVYMCLECRIELQYTDCMEAVVSVDLKAEIKRKGWKLKEIAERWGLSVRRISQIVKSPSAQHIDAVRGLPSKIIK